MIVLIRALIAITRPVSKRLSPCALNGMLVGVVVGHIFAVLWFVGTGTASVPLMYPLWLYIALVLAMFCWVCLMVVLCWFLKYEFWPLAAAVFVNALLTSILTVYLCNLSGVSSIFFLIGILVGYGVGGLLCRLCDIFISLAKEG